MIEKYHFSEKEDFLKNLRNFSLKSQERSSLINNELIHIAQKDTTPDFLEILNNSDLILLMREIGNNLNNVSINLHPEYQEIDSFQNAKNNRFYSFISKLSELVDDGEKTNVTAFLNKNRKCLGMADGLLGLQELVQIFSEIERRELLSDKDNLILIHYFGSFNPFPHNGHIEAARNANKESKESRIIVTTTATNPNKPELVSTVSQRLNNLQRGFFYEDYSTVLGLIGDFSNRKHRLEQLSIISTFDYENKSRFLIGSDMLQKRVKEALEGDEYALFVLKENNTIFVSPRNEDDSNQFYKTVDIARSIFSSDIKILPTPNYTLSGTLIRSFPLDQRRKFCPNDFVNLE